VSDPTLARIVLLAVLILAAMLARRYLDWSFRSKEEERVFWRWLKHENPAEYRRLRPRGLANRH
jgi:hypothetical protein